MKKPISLIVMAAVLTACSNAQKITSLEKNSSEIKMDYSQNDYKKLNQDLEENKVFLAGELHGLEENYILRLNLMMYLNESAGVNYYLAEMGYSSSYFINKYLKTGEEKYLYVVVNSIMGSYDYSLDDINFWKNLYKYNQTLTASRRIKVIGLDIEHQFWLAVMQLNDMVEDLNLGEEMEPVLGGLEYFSASISPDIDNTKNILKNISNLDIPEILDIISKLEENFENNPHLYRKIFSEEDYQNFEFALSNITETERIYINRKNKEYFNTEREKAIYKNFLKAHEIYPDEKFFGQWGSFHVLQKSNTNERRFAQYLNSDSSPVKDKVISIKYVYDNKYHRKKNRKILNAFKQYGDSKFTLYRLNQLNHEKIITCPLNDYGSEDVREFFQYAILIRAPQKVRTVPS